jgi:hypothetical protein
VINNPLFLMVIYTYVSLPIPLPNPASKSIMSIIFNALPLPPPISEFGEPFYRSIEQAIEAINMHAQPQGFAVSI